MGGEFLLFTGALRVFADFSCARDDFTVVHDTEHPGFQILREKYPIKQTAGDGGDFAKAERLMRWVCENVAHNGGTKEVPGDLLDSVSILDYSFGKGRECGVVCRHQAIVFTECCLALGLTARTIHCLPFGPYDCDTHVVSMVYIRELAKWVLFDQSNNAYFQDRDGTPLSPLEARELLGLDQAVVSANVRPFSSCDYESKAGDYKRYMAKNLFYIKFSAVNTFGTDLVKGQKTYFLIPRGFDVKNREIAYCEYGADNSPEIYRDSWRGYSGEMKAQQINPVSAGQFLRIR